MLFALERRMSSWLITKMAAAVCEAFCSFLDTEVTSMFIKSSRLRSARSLGRFCGQAGQMRLTAMAVPSRAEKRSRFINESSESPCQLDQSAVLDSGAQYRGVRVRDFHLLMTPLTAWPLSVSANEASDRQLDLHQIAILLQSLSALTGKTFSMDEARNMLRLPVRELWGTVFCALLW